jgi:hypothetical protein
LKNKGTKFLNMLLGKRRNPLHNCSISIYIYICWIIENLWTVLIKVFMKSKSGIQYVQHINSNNLQYVCHKLRGMSLSFTFRCGQYFWMNYTKCYCEKIYNCNKDSGLFNVFMSHILLYLYVSICFDFYYTSPGQNWTQ